MTSPEAVAMTPLDSLAHAALYLVEAQDAGEDTTVPREVYELARARVEQGEKR